MFHLHFLTILSTKKNPKKTIKASVEMEKPFVGSD